MNWGVVAGIIGSILGAAALVGSGWFAARATRAAARLTAEAQAAAAKAAAEPAQRQADLATFKEIRDDLNQRLERSERRIDTLTSLVRAYAWTVDRLIYRMRQSNIGPEPEDIHDMVRNHMRTGV